MGRHVAKVKMDYSGLATLLRTKHPVDRSIAVFSVPPMPDLEVLDIYGDIDDRANKRCWVVVESKYLDEVPEGKIIPEAPVIAFTTLYHEHKDRQLHVYTRKGLPLFQRVRIRILEALGYKAI